MHMCTKRMRGLGVQHDMGQQTDLVDRSNISNLLYNLKTF